MCLSTMKPCSLMGALALSDIFGARCHTFAFQMIVIRLEIQRVQN